MFILPSVMYFGLGVLTLSKVIMSHCISQGWGCWGLKFGCTAFHQALALWFLSKASVIAGLYLVQFKSMGILSFPFVSDFTF